MTELADISKELRNIIDGYITGHRSRSLATLSRVSGVPYTTIRRFSNGEGHPTAEPVLKIVDVTLAHQDKLSFLNRHFPEIARTIDTIHNQRLLDDDSNNAAEVKTFLSRDPHSFILNLVINDQVTTTDDISRLCGLRGLNALEELKDADIVEFKNLADCVQVLPKSTVMLCFDAETILDQIRIATRYFDRTLIGTKCAKLCHATSSVNSEGMNKIHEIISNAITEVFSIKDDPKYAGSIPFFADFMLNILDKSALTPEEHQ